MKKSPNWLEMPDEVMVNVFQRLPTVQVLNSVRKVCTTWRRICNYAEIWKVIYMLNRTFDGRYTDSDPVALTKKAVDLSCGELIDIRIQWFATEELFDYIVLNSKKLKRICLMSCFGIKGSALSLAVKNLPQLEELHLLETLIKARDVEAIGRNCPHLKSFKMWNTSIPTIDNNALAIAKNMPELRHLTLLQIGMTNNGLEAIVKGCPHLESLDVRWCDHLDLDGDLGKLCKKRIKDFKHGSQEFRGQTYDEFYESYFNEDFCEDDMYDDDMHDEFYYDAYFNED